MIRHIVEISREPAHVTVRNSQLVLKRDDKVVGSMACEDVGVVLVDHPRVTYSHAALVELAESKAVVVVCGRNHLPSAMLVPFADHSEVVWRNRDQLSAPKPLRKRLWKQIVEAKVLAQSENLIPATTPHKKLVTLAQSVRSGDPENIEAQAAKIYWSHWLRDKDPSNASDADEGIPLHFFRDQKGSGINALLNYGYAIARAAIARALVAAGLIPSLGIHHRNRGNPFCLADDLIEPLRPLVDRAVRSLYHQGRSTLDQSVKAELLKILEQRVSYRGVASPMMVSLHRYSSSLASCYAGKSKRLDIPQLLPCSESVDVC